MSDDFPVFQILQMAINGDMSIDRAVDLMMTDYNKPRNRLKRFLMSIVEALTPV